MAVYTEERRTGYNDGRQLASKMLISTKVEARMIMRALADNTTMVDVVMGNTPYAQSYRKGFAERMTERCEYFLCHTED